MKEKDFTIKIESSKDLSQEEKQRLLWECFDILFSNNSHKEQKIICQERKK